MESCPLPETYRAAFLRAGDQELFTGAEDKDVRRSIHIGDVPMPELAPDEVLVAVRATQLVRKPPHLTWEEAACNTLCLSTAYRISSATTVPESRWAMQPWMVGRCRQR